MCDFEILNICVIGKRKWAQTHSHGDGLDNDRFLLEYEKPIKYNFNTNR